VRAEQHNEALLIVSVLSASLVPPHTRKIGIIEVTQLYKIIKIGISWNVCAPCTIIMAGVNFMKK
jgi:hypothetical protein